ncbi:hypothetical protein R3P38DRAFT_3046094 [Favolaschia claudopus]|uniref:Uncharacterized protein n=1 Tax=Favolaschia claudopus TaxID=2862362 RepID=A0AAW0A756_9AGAR
MSQEPVDTGWMGWMLSEISAASPSQDTIKVSCAIAVTQPKKGTIFELIPALPIPSNRIITRTDANSIRVAALLHALRFGLMHKTVAFASDLVTQLVTGTFPLPSTVLVSTTRVPDFETERYRSPLSAHIVIGDLCQVCGEIDLQIFDHTSEYSVGEVLATRLTPASQEFFASYSPMAVMPETTFALIFSLSVDSADLIFHPPTLIRSSSVASFETELHSTNSNNPTSSSSAGSDFFAPHCAHSADVLDPSVYSCPPPPSNHHLSTSPASTPQRSLAGRSRSASVSACLQSLKALLPTLTPPLSDSALNAAQGGKGSGSLLLQIRNFHSMQKLLDAFQLKAVPDKKKSPTEVFSDAFGGEHTLSGNSVVEACGWSARTFCNKARRLEKIQQILKQYDWNGDIPDGSDESKEGKARYKAYKLWLGIVYMWSPTGPIVTDQEPDGKSNNPNEQYASTLTQSSIELSEIWITTYLKKS